MNQKILKLIENNARLSNDDIATITGLDVREVEGAIREMESSGIIRGYKTIIDREKIYENTVSATIELKVVPKAERGFEEVADRIARYPEVESVSLMSGGCDLSVVVTGKTFREVSTFVANELATIDAVTATAVFSLELKGTGRCHLTNDAIPHTSDIFLAPGETVDVWCDMEEVLRRDRELTSPGPVLNMIPVRTNGRYADVNNRDHVIREGLADPSGPEHRHHAATFASSAEAADALLADYSACLAAISDEPVPSMQKALKVIELRLRTFCAAATAGKITAEEIFFPSRARSTS